MKNTLVKYSNVKGNFTTIFQGEITKEERKELATSFIFHTHHINGFVVQEIGFELTDELETICVSIHDVIQALVMDHEYIIPSPHLNFYKFEVCITRNIPFGDVLASMGIGGTSVSTGIVKAVNEKRAESLVWTQMPLQEGDVIQWVKIKKLPDDEKEMMLELCSYSAI